MTTFLALLRGINVSGQKKIPMAELREVLTKAGLKDVRTYIQTGNVIFKSDRREGLDQSIRKAIEDFYGWEVQVLVRTREEIQEVLNGCPFPKEKMEQSYFTLLNEMPSEENRKRVEEVSVEGEEFHFGNRCIYFYSSHGYGRAKLNNNWFENKLKVSATSRNFKTLNTLLKLMLEAQT